MPWSMRLVPKNVARGRLLVRIPGASAVRPHVDHRRTQ